MYIIGIFYKHQACISTHICIHVYNIILDVPAAAYAHIYDLWRTLLQQLRLQSRAISSNRINRVANNIILYVCKYAHCIIKYVYSFIVVHACSLFKKNFLRLISDHIFFFRSHTPPDKCEHTRQHQLD